MSINFLPKDKKAVLLAPMAGAADSSFRRVCRSLGAYACTSEMVSAKAIRMGDRKTPLLCRFHEDERPFGIQLFGNEPLDMAYAARFAEQQFSPDFIDINMGCPAPKITGGGSGSALMKSFSLACSIADAVVCSVKLPVTVKLRAGFEETNADLLAPMLEGVGVAAITVHGRTRERMYKPPVDLEIIKRVKNSVTIPVIGNGDIFGPSEALKMLEYTGCDAVMIGRAALGNPYIFADVAAVIGGCQPPDEPSAMERMDTLRRQVAAMCEEKGEFIGMREARKHTAWYMKGLRGAAAFRQRASSLETMADLDEYIRLVLGANQQ